MDIDSKTLLKLAVEGIGKNKIEIEKWHELYLARFHSTFFSRMKRYSTGLHFTGRT